MGRRRLRKFTTAIVLPPIRALLWLFPLAPPNWDEWSNFKKERFRCRALRGAGWLVLPLAACVLLFYLEENTRGWLAWLKFRKEWEAKGEHFEISYFIPPPIPDDQNFAAAPVVASTYAYCLDRLGQRIYPPDTNVADRLMMQIFNPFASESPKVGNWRFSQKTDLKDWQLYYRDQKAYCQSADAQKMAHKAKGRGGFGTRGPRGRALPVARNTESSVTNYFPIPPAPGEPGADVLIALGKYKSGLDELADAARRPLSRFPLNYESVGWDSPSLMIFPHWASLRQCAQVLQLRAMAKLSVGDTAAAFDDVRLMFRLADAVTNEPAEVSSRLRGEILNDTIQPVWEGLARHRWSHQQSSLLAERFASFDFVSECIWQIRVSEARSCDFIDHLRETHNQFFEPQTVDNPATEDWLIYFRLRLFPSGWYYLNKIKACETFIAQRRAVEAANYAGVGLILPQNLSENRSNVLAVVALNRYGVVPYPFLNSQCATRLASIACSLECYRFDRGRYPARLEQLVPEYAKVPLKNVFNGGLLHYEVQSNANFILYSTDASGVDNRATAHLTFGYKVEGDFVWRYP